MSTPNKLVEFTFDNLLEWYNKCQNTSFEKGAEYALNIINSVPCIIDQHEYLIRQRNWLAKELAGVVPIDIDADLFIKEAEEAALEPPALSEVDILKDRIAELTKQRDEYAAKLAKARGYKYVGEMYLDDHYEESVRRASETD